MLTGIETGLIPPVCRFRWKSTPGTSSSPTAQLETVTINVQGATPPSKDVLATFRQPHGEGMDIVLKDAKGEHGFGTIPVSK
jgi:hypothetical protein